jgi:hypothetical protein
MQILVGHLGNLEEIICGISWEPIDGCTHPLFETTKRTVDRHFG